MRVVTLTLASIGLLCVACTALIVATVIHDARVDRRRRQARRDAVRPPAARLGTDAEFRRIVRNNFPRPINDKETHP